MPLAALAFLLSASSEPEAPIVLPSQVDPTASTWVVRLKAGGKEGDFTVNLNSRRSAVSRAWFGPNADDKALEITSGDRKVGKASLLVDALPPDQGKGSAGVIGQDVLGAYALGFDGTATTLTLWKEGLSKAEAAAWMGGSVERAPLKIQSNGNLVIAVTLRGKEAWLLARPGLPMPLLLKRVGTGADLPVDTLSLTDRGKEQTATRFMTDEMSIGGVPVPFGQYS